MSNRNKRVKDFKRSMFPLASEEDLMSEEEKREAAKRKALEKLKKGK